MYNQVYRVAVVCECYYDISNFARCLTSELSFHLTRSLTNTAPMKDWCDWGLLRPHAGWGNEEMWTADANCISAWNSSDSVEVWQSHPCLVSCSLLVAPNRSYSPCARFPLVFLISEARSSDSRTTRLISRSFHFLNSEGLPGSSARRKLNSSCI